VAKKWMRAAPWRETQDLIDKISSCSGCGTAARWCLVSEDTAFAFCGACCCRWAHPGSPAMDEDDPYQSCPQCSLVEVNP
jgi:hypothetical protein